MIHFREGIRFYKHQQLVRNIYLFKYGHFTGFSYTKFKSLFFLFSVWRMREKKKERKNILVWIETSEFLPGFDEVIIFE